MPHLDRRGGNNGNDGRIMVALGDVVHFDDLGRHGRAGSKSVTAPGTDTKAQLTSGTGGGG